MKRINFYFKYAWRSVLRGGQRTFFAILCVAVGVAALVALQVLGSSIEATLTGDTKAQAGGDVVARVSSAALSGRVSSRFDASDQALLDRLKSEGTITEWTGLIVQNDIRLKNFFSFPPSLYAVDPKIYPLYGNLEILQPKDNKNLNQLLSQPNSVIVSKNLWEKLDLKLGQEIEAAGGNGQNVKLKVVAESNIVLPGVIFGPGQFFGYLMVSQETIATMYDSSELAPSTIFVKTPNDTAMAQAKTALNRRFDAQTAYDIQSQLTRGISITQDFLSYIGLLSLLVGGIGVINTMLVVIGRRTTEIATVKALGLKTRQTLFIFTLEALLLGVMGSILGVVLGELLGLGIKGVAEGFFARPLAWSLYPTPIIIGMIVGILTSAVFGFLPSFAAAKVRPAVVLRAQNSFVPRIGGFTGLVIIVLMAVAMGVIAGVLIKDIGLGIIISLITMLVIGLIVGGLWIIIAVIGLLPTPRSPSIKMALRSFSRHRGRTATTLMVMIVGLFFISFITFVADSVKATIRSAFDVQLGYNTIGFSGLLTGSTAQITEQTVTNLGAIKGIQKVYPGNFASTRVVAINGSTSSSGGIGFSASVSGRSFVNGETAGGNNSKKVLEGRNLTPADADSNVLLVSKSRAANYNLKVGDTITLRSQGAFGSTSSSSSRPTADFKIVGIMDEANQTINVEGDWVAPFNSVNKLGSQITIYYMLIDRVQKQATLQQTQEFLPNVLDLDDLIDTFNRLLDQILAFPLILSLLSLFSGAILVANNVALAVLERRTEIGVLKAVGAKRKRVMGILLWESGLVGLLGGIIGVGAGILIAINVNALTNAGSRGSGIDFTWSPGVAALLLLLGIGLALFATIVSAWGAVQEKPLVVLRYE